VTIRRPRGADWPARKPHDYYRTPGAVVDALLSVLSLEGTIWEPACGDGALARILQAHGYEVVSTDLVERGYGSQADFLATDRLLGDNIVTNPPFSLAADFILHALDLKPRLVAFLLNSTFWHAGRRLAMFRASRPAMILPLTWRPDFTGTGSPMMDCMWCVWQPGYSGETIYRPLDRPEDTVELCP
jgi:hypothetical protein